MKVNKIDKKVLLPFKELLRYQIVYDLVFVKKESVIPFDIELLTLLSFCGEIELGKFCTQATKELYEIQELEDFANKSQNIRNRINKLVKRNLIMKSMGNKKFIRLNDNITVHRESNLLLNYNFLGIENKEEGNNK